MATCNAHPSHCLKGGCRSNPFITKPKFVEISRNLFSGIELTSLDQQIERIQEFQILLSDDKPGCQELLASGALTTLANFLQDDCHCLTLQLEVVKVFEIITSWEYWYINCVADKGVVSVLVRTLHYSKYHSKYKRIREQAVLVLGRIIASSTKNRDSAIEEGALRAILGQVNLCDNDGALENIRKAVGSCFARSPPPKFSIVERSILPLTELVFHPNEDFVKVACDALGCLTKGTNDEIQKVVDCAVELQLVELLRHSSPAVRASALKVVGNIAAGNESQTQTVIDSDALRSLLLLLSDPSETIRRDTCWTISSIMAGTKKQIQSVIDSNIVSSLINLIMNGEQTVQAEALWSFANATSGGTIDQIQILVSKGCIRPLCKVLALEDDKNISIALDSLDNILKAGQKVTVKGARNRMSTMISEAGGLGLIEDLQSSSNSDISAKCKNILYHYFGRDASNAANPQTTPAAKNSGSSNVPYQPTTVFDGTNYIKFQTISGMPSHSAKSVEEVRVEDYMAGNKGKGVSIFNATTTKSKKSGSGVKTNFTNRKCGGRIKPTRNMFSTGVTAKPSFSSFPSATTQPCGGRIKLTRNVFNSGATAKPSLSSFVGGSAQPTFSFKLPDSSESTTSSFSFEAPKASFNSSAFSFGAEAATSGFCTGERVAPSFSFGAANAETTSKAFQSNSFSFGARPIRSATKTQPFSFGNTKLKESNPLTSPLSSRKKSRAGDEATSSFSFFKFEAPVGEKKIKFPTEEKKPVKIFSTVDSPSIKRNLSATSDVESKQPKSFCSSSQVSTFVFGDGKGSNDETTGDVEKKPTFHMGIVSTDPSNTTKSIQGRSRKKKGSEKSTRRSFISTFGFSLGMNSSHQPSFSCFGTFKDKGKPFVFGKASINVDETCGSRALKDEKNGNESTHGTKNSKECESGKASSPNKAEVPATQKSPLENGAGFSSCEGLDKTTKINSDSRSACCSSSSTAVSSQLSELKMQNPPDASIANSHKIEFAECEEEKSPAGVKENEDFGFEKCSVPEVEQEFVILNLNSEEETPSRNEVVTTVTKNAEHKDYNAGHDVDRAPSTFDGKASTRPVTEEKKLLDDDTHLISEIKNQKSKDGNSEGETKMPLKDVKGKEPSPESAIMLVNGAPIEHSEENITRPLDLNHQVESNNDSKANLHSMVTINADDESSSIDEMKKMINDLSKKMETLSDSHNRLKESSSREKALQSDQIRNVKTSSLPDETAALRRRLDLVEKELDTLRRENTEMKLVSAHHSDERKQVELGDQSNQRGIPQVPPLAVRNNLFLNLADQLERNGGDFADHDQSDRKLEIDSRLHRLNGVNMIHLKSLVVEYISKTPSEQAAILPALATLLQFDESDYRAIEKRG